MGSLDYRQPLGSSARFELVGLILEKDVKGRKRPVATRNVLMKFELVGLSQFVTCVHFLFEDTEVIADHHDLVEECFQRHFFRLK